MNGRELEVKYATDLSLDKFVSLVKSKYTKPTLEKHIAFDTDWYYKNAEGITVRHRYATDGLHELTVKSRDGNYEKRDEFNIDLGPNDTNLIASWMQCAGFVPEFYFDKELYVFNFEHFQIAYYEVKNTPFKFIEIEYLGSDTCENTIILKLHGIADSLGLTENVNRSIYNMYKEYHNEISKDPTRN